MRDVVLRVDLSSRLLYRGLSRSRDLATGNGHLPGDLAGREDLYPREIPFGSLDYSLRYESLRLYHIPVLEILFDRRERHRDRDFRERFERVSAELRHSLDEVSELRALLVAGPRVLTLGSSARGLASLASSSYLGGLVVRGLSF